MIDRSKNLRSVPFALFPQTKRLLHSIFLAMQPPRLDSLARKRLLVNREFYIHKLKRRRSATPCQQTQLEAIQNPLFHNYLSTTSFTPRQLQHRPPLRQNQPIVIREITAS